MMTPDRMTTSYFPSDAAPLLDTLLQASVAKAPEATLGLGIAVAEACEDDGRTVTARMGAECIVASVAVSCLVRPIEGDTVLLARSGTAAFILAVLERDGPNHATLTLPGHGNLAIEGETLSFSARQRLAIRADGLDLRSRTMAVLADKATWLGKALSVVTERWHISARSHEVVADSLIEKAVNRTAIVDGVDTVRAETRMVKTTGVATETAHSKVVAVTEDLRLDGKRITMG